MMRIFLFLATNAAVLVLISVVFQVLGIEGILAENNVDLNLQALLVMSAVIGFGGSFISLAMSKWVAKRSTRAKVIEKPENEVEAWLLEVVKKQADKLGIGMPEVAIFPSPDPNAFATGMFRNNALVAVSVGLLNGMNKEQVEAVNDPEKTHSARVLAGMRAHDEGYFHFARRMSLQHQRYFLDLPTNDRQFSEFDEGVKRSIVEQRAIEAADTLPFDEYLENYFSQTL